MKKLKYLLFLLAATTGFSQIAYDLRLLQVNSGGTAYTEVLLPGAASITDMASFRTFIGLGGLDNPAHSTLNLVGANSLALGTGSTNFGSINFKNGTNNNTITIISGVTGVTYTMTLPTATAGGDNYLLNMDADGTMDWTNPASLGGGSVEGTAVLSTGEVGGIKFLREDGDGTSSWQTIPGGGDALTSSPLSQFAATTSLQLKDTISDETGSGAAVFGTSPTLTTPTIISAQYRVGYVALAGTVIDTTEGRMQTKTITDSTVVFTFDGTPTAGARFFLRVTNGSASDQTYDIPGNYSENYNGSHTTLTVPGSGIATTTFEYDGTQYLASTSVDFFADVALDETPTDTSVDRMPYYDAATKAAKGITIDALNGLAVTLIQTGGLNMGATVFELPNGTSGTTDATGEIFMDTNGDGGTNFNGPVVQIYDGSANKYLFPVALPLAASEDNYILKYDATAKTVDWEADDGSGAGDDLGAGDPGANGLMARTAADTTSARTLQSDADGRITWTNGDGVSGNPVPVITLFGTNPAFGANEAAWSTTGIVFEGATSDLVETYLVAADPTSSDKTITLPDATGTVSLVAGTETLTNKTIDADSNTLLASTEILTGGGTYALDAADCSKSKTFYVQQAGTATLPAVADGYALTFIADGAVAITVDPNGSEVLRVDGTAQTGGVTLVSDGTAAATAVFQYHSSGVWFVLTDGHWAAGS